MLHRIACLLVAALAPFLVFRDAYAGVTVERAPVAPMCMVYGSPVSGVLLVSLESIIVNSLLGGSTLTFVLHGQDGPQTYVVPPGQAVGAVLIPSMNPAGTCLIKLTDTGGASQGRASVTIERSP